MNAQTPAPLESAAPRRTLSLERRLPLIMTGVLALALASTLVLAYATLARTARVAANERLHGAVDQLAIAASQGVQRAADTVSAVAHEPAVVAAVARDGAGRIDSQAVFVHLRRLRTPTDTTLPVVLWSVTGRRVAMIGNAVAVPPDVPGLRPPESGATAIPVPGLEALAASDSPRVGAMYLANGRIAFWIGAPVTVAGRRRGYVTAKHEVQANPQTTRTIRTLSSDHVTAYYRDLDRPFWATASGVVARPPDRRDSTPRGVLVTRAAQPYLTAEQRIPGTDLALVLEAPLSDVLAGPRRSTMQLAAISFAILILGSFALWVISRRITRPIVDLTTAAERLAAGDYGARVTAARGDEIGRLASSFNRMAQQIGTSRDELELQTAQARAASRAKSDFLATMSHELRTPLNAIAGYVDLLDMGLRGPVTEAQQRDLARIRASQQHLLGLISSILDLTRIESGQLAYTLEPVVLAPLLGGLDVLIGPQATTKDLSLRVAECAPDITAIADHEKLRQVLLNLISNAIRYTPGGGEVTLSCEVVSGDTVAITVADTGIGIPPEKHAEVFEPFVQLDRSLTRTPEGVGIGLAISRDLARGMGGDLTVASAPGRGSRFTVTLPRARAGSAGAGRISGETPATRAAPRISR